MSRVEDTLCSSCSSPLALTIFPLLFCSLPWAEGVKIVLLMSQLGWAPHTQFSAFGPVVDFYSGFHLLGEKKCFLMRYESYACRGYKDAFLEYSWELRRFWNVASVDSPLGPMTLPVMAI